MKHTPFFLALSLCAPTLAVAAPLLFGASNVLKSTSDQTGCIPAAVQSVLKDVAGKFGSVRVVSGYRSPADNHRRGGASSSQHTLCKAADFLIPNRASRSQQVQLQKFLLAEKAKYGIRYNVYCTGRSHIDDNNRGLPDSYSSCVEKETWRGRPAKTYTRTRSRAHKASYF